VSGKASGTAEERQKWFVGQLAAGKPLRRADLEDQFSISVATAKRDLLALSESVTFDAQSKSYRLKKGSSRR
jgi:DeoR/GlpR family transcriptional regulator of sugar metabolism